MVARDPESPRGPDLDEERYGGPTKWDFRPPHPIGHSTVIVEMIVEGELPMSRCRTAAPSPGSDA